jgi:hypothetical protein
MSAINGSVEYSKVLPLIKFPTYTISDTSTMGTNVYIAIKSSQ